MMFALALLLVSTAVPGRVAILSEPFALEAQVARELCPEPKARLVLRVAPQGAFDQRAELDPLAVIGSPSATIALDMSAARPGDDPALVARVSASNCVVLEGGTWLDWWHALRPYGKQSELGRALVAAHAGGTNVIGVGPAGAHLGAMCILSRATLQRPSRDPHATAADVVLGGLALARGACIDFETDGRGDPERMLEAAFDRRVDLAVWLAGPCAWIEDAGSKVATLAGPGAAFVFDAQDARRSRESLEDVRVSRLLAGGSFDLASRRSTPASLPREERSVQNESTITLRDVFAAPNTGNAWNSRKVLDLAGEGRRLRLTFDASSNSARTTPAALGRDTARLDWLPRRP